jgi:hypothetical protein
VTAPVEPFTLTTTIVEPNGPGGINGPPIRVGVYRVIRTRKNAASLTVTFNPPNAALLDTDFDAMTDDELAALPGKVSPK